jgi:BMFP domain-containing protein YqiC
MRSNATVTVSDLTQLIEAREETRAELRLLAIRAYEHWLELEAKIEELEHRLDEARRTSPPAEEAEGPRP